VFPPLAGFQVTINGRIWVTAEALHLRIDSIEQAIRVCAPDCDLRDLGYRVAYAVAEDNLRIGHTVVADCVNPIQLTRDAWLAVAKRATVDAVKSKSDVRTRMNTDDAWKHDSRIFRDWNSRSGPM